MRISDWSSDVCSSDLPFGHALAGMLAGIKPHLRVAASHFNAVDRLTFEAGAQAAVRDPVTLGDRSDQVVVPFTRIGRAIGDPQKRAFGGVTDGQRARILAGVEIG